MNVTQHKKYNKYNNKIETMTLSAGNVTRMVASYSYDDIGRLVSIKRSGNVLRGYDFAYDGLNRLEESTYSEGAGMSQNKNRYSENILSYSPNGSIERLQRYGKKNNGTFGLIDDLMYSYNGNQIKAISDKAGSLLYDGSFDFKDGANADVEYFYDTNGALIKDLNKDISKIEYDILGNLKCITFSNGFKTKYIYDAAGNKLRITHESVVTNTTDYIGNFVLEDGKLSKYLFDGGYCSFDNNQNPSFHYYEKDHLGSVRMVVNENGTIEQVNHYYPFGGVYGDLSYKGELQRNKYIGKEFDHMYGLDWYDHGARMYDAARLAWDRMEPLYDKYYPLNTYLYSGNNPINSIDDDGNRIIVWYKDKIGNDQSFVFTGQETKELPQNQFVRDFIQAYFYNINNGGGKAMLEAAKSQVDFNLFNALDLKVNESYYQNNGRKDKYVVWQSRQGLLLSNGDKQSAATILEHEFAHYVDDVLNHKNHKDREQTKDYQYDNKEEKRVITGYESLTARKNKEGIRKNHKGKNFPTKNSFSIK